MPSKKRPEPLPTKPEFDLATARDVLARRGRNVDAMTKTQIRELYAALPADAPELAQPQEAAPHALPAPDNDLDRPADDTRDGVTDADE